MRYKMSLSHRRSKSKAVTYIYDLPYAERRTLCNILDDNNDWEKLGGVYMKMTWVELQEIRRAERCGDSPTNRLLTAWGHQNHTVLELYRLLLQMEHFQAMSVIKECVEEKYHSLCTSRDSRFMRIYQDTVRMESQASEMANEGTSLVPRAATRTQGMAISPHSEAQTPPTVQLQPARSPAHPQHSSQNMRQLEGACAMVNEGASAFPNSFKKYSPDNLNQSSRNIPASPKVPDSLLQPVPAVFVHSPTQPVSISAQQPQSINSQVYGAQVEKKIYNDEIMCPELVSCDDNNPEETQTTMCKASQIDFQQEYVEKARAKEQALAAGHKDTGGAKSSKGKIEKQPNPMLSADSSKCSVPEIPYKELEEATMFWSKDHLLGRGGFGSVFRGIWKNTEVAIKRIDPHGDARINSTPLHIIQSLDELKLLQSYRHDNILQVYGYSADVDHTPCLVYQFMPNGSLEDRLLCRKIEAFGADGIPCGTPVPLTWWQRYKIACGTAKALQFLHTVKDKPLIHGDVKSANILLDKNYEPKLGDFGLAREGKSQNTSVKVSRVHGTKPYLPAEYLKYKKLSVKVDTYSYGIVLFEVCTGLRAYDDKRKEKEKFLKELIDDTVEEETLRDRTAGMGPHSDVYNILYRLGKNCVQDISSRRPTMTDVFKELKHFGQVSCERERARKISQGETSSVSSSPYMLQWIYDTRSIPYASASPSPQPSLPQHFHQSPPLSAMSAHPAYQSPPSPSLPSSSPVPPILTPNSPILTHQSPRQAGPTSFPVAVASANGGVPYHPRHLHYGIAAARKQNVGGNLAAYGGGNPYPGQPHLYPPQISVSPVMAAGAAPRRDPPSHHEGPLAMGAPNYAQPLIPQFSKLNMSSSSNSSTSNSKSSVNSYDSNSASSLIANTTHNLGQTNGPSQIHANTGRVVGGQAFGLSVPSGQNPNANPREEVNAPLQPLITELGIKSTDSMSGVSLDSTMQQPTAQNKKSLFD